MKKVLISIFCLLVSQINQAQEKENKSFSVDFSGYVDIYYLYSLNKPHTNDYSSYAYAYNRHDELNLNLGFVKAAFQGDRVFASFALQSGSYAKANYAAEPSEYRSIAEANLGFKLNDKITIDAGVLPSHIGIESATGSDCYNLTRSINADGSPYFETGARIKYAVNENLEVSGLILNGWQTIEENNNDKSLGTQIYFSKNDKLAINYSTYYGNDVPKGSPKQPWFFHDLSIEIQDIFPNFKAVLVVDQMYKNQLTGGGYDQMTTGVLQGYYEAKKFGIGVRVEHYNDPNEVVNSSGTTNGFQTTSASLNLDFPIKEKMLWRIEGRYFDSKDAIFLTEKIGTFSNVMSVVSTSLSVKF